MSSRGMRTRAPNQLCRRRRDPLESLRLRSPSQRRQGLLALPCQQWPDLLALPCQRWPLLCQRRRDLLEQVRRLEQSSSLTLRSPRNLSRLQRMPARMQFQSCHRWRLLRCLELRRKRLWMRHVVLQGRASPHQRSHQLAPRPLSLRQPRRLRCLRPCLCVKPWSHRLYRP